jgi:hypothetical protein
MRIDLAAAATNAWALFKRDRDVLLALSGMFLFLPTLATLLLIPSAPKKLAAGASRAMIEQWANGYADWLVGNLPWLGLSATASLFGSLAVIAFYVDPARPDVSGAMLAALRRFPGYLALMFVITLVASLGLLLLIVPGLWVLGRTMLAGPAMIGTRSGAAEAVRRSVDWTRGHGLVLAGLAGVGTFGGQLLASPFLALDEALRSADAANPVAIAIVNIGAAAAASVVALAMILLRVTIYWSVADDSRGT